MADAGGALKAVGFLDRHERMEQYLRSLPGAAPAAMRPAADPGGLTSALRDYFSGDLRALDRLPLAAEGTEFQRAVWKALQEIPCGETRSYADIARRIGRPKAVRAVGLANGQNPIAVVVPCHRVIGSNGSLTGYGGGLDRKRWLLAHEGAALG